MCEENMEAVSLEERDHQAVSFCRNSQSSSKGKTMYKYKDLLK